jgi:hypothetical protein
LNVSKQREALLTAIKGLENGRQTRWRTGQEAEANEVGYGKTINIFLAHYSAKNKRNMRLVTRVPIGG